MFMRATPAGVSSRSLNSSHAGRTTTGPSVAVGPEELEDQGITSERESDRLAVAELATRLDHAEPMTCCNLLREALHGRCQGPFVEAGALGGLRD